MPGCGASSRGVRGSPADRITEGKKSFCCVTTRRRKFWVLNGLRRGLRSLAARFLRLGVLGFDVGVLAMFGLPPRRLPAADLAAGIPDPGSSAGSNTAAGTCARTLCAGRSAGAAGALWPDGGAFP